MVWRRLDDRRSSRIEVPVNSQLGLKDEAQCEKIQTDLIATMVKFEDALKARIRQLQ